MSNDVLIAGGRHFDNYSLMCDVLDRYRLHYTIDYIIQGMAPGADLLAKDYARDNGISCINMPADWTKYGKGAGYRRNAEMWNIATSGIIFWDGKSPGTGHSLQLSVKLDKTLFVCNYVTNDFYLHHLGKAR